MVASIFAAAAFWGFFIERHRLIEKTYYIDGLPEEIILIADLHLRCELKLFEKVAEAIMKNPAGILISAGDTFETIKDYRILKAFAGKACYFVLGNNDYGNINSYGREMKIKALLKKYGVKVLQNGSVSEDSLTVIGVDDPHKKKQNIEKAFRDIPEGTFRLAVVHSPEANMEILKMSPDLVFYGHTHGGQIRVPFIGSIFDNTEKCLKTPLGVHRIGNTVFVHSSGIGTTLFPLRFLNPPEIIYLKPSKKEIPGS